MSETRIHWADSMNVGEYRKEVASIIREQMCDPDLADKVEALSDKHMLLKHSCMSPQQAAERIMDEAQHYTTCVSCERMNIPIIDNGAPSLCEECEANAGDIIQNLKAQIDMFWLTIHDLEKRVKAM